MRIQVNGEARECPAGTLQDVLQALGYGGTVVATAVNQDFVPVARRPAYVVAEGDRIEVLAPMQGG